MPDIGLLSKVFYFWDFLESKEILEILVQYIGALEDVSTLALSFLWNPEFKNLTGPTSGGNLGGNGSNSINSTNICIDPGTK